MSLRVWNSLLERQGLEEMVWAACMLLKMDETSSVSSISSDGTISTTSSIDTAGSDDSTISILLMHTLHYAHFLLVPIGNPNIIWGRQLKIEEIAESTCIDEFRFRKQDLYYIFNMLWDKMHLVLEVAAQHQELYLL